MEILTQIIQGGWEVLLEYLSTHVITCFVPAFFIGGVIAVLILRVRYFVTLVIKRRNSSIIASLSCR